MVELLHDDCMNVMAKYPDKFFEFAIVDPPYGIGNFIPQNLPKNGVKVSDEVKWNDEIPIQNYFQELIRISKEQIIWGANYYNCFPKSGGALVWDKGGINPVFSQCEIASLSFQKKIDYVCINWQSGFYRASIEKIIHPCQKPIKLYKWLLHNYAKQGDKILDTHLGSGSIAIACHDMGFDLVGCEIDADYYKAACKRFKEQTMQLKLIA